MKIGKVLKNCVLALLSSGWLIILLLALHQLIVWYCSEPDGVEKKASFQLIVFESLLTISLLWFFAGLFCWSYRTLKRD
jgi:hypothetical protein